MRFEFGFLAHDGLRYLLLHRRRKRWLESGAKHADRFLETKCGSGNALTYELCIVSSLLSHNEVGEMQWSETELL